MQEKPMVMPKNFWASEKIHLRSCCESDIDTYVNEENDSESIRFFEGRVDPPRSAALWKEWIDKQAKQQDPNCLAFTIESLEQQIVGFANIREWTNHAGTFTFGIRIFNAYQRQGFALDAAKIILRYGFGELRCQKANSSTIETNVKSIAFHQKLGFREEGRIRRNDFTDGHYYDALLFGLTVEEFIEVDKRG